MEPSPKVISTEKILNASKYDTDKAAHKHYLRNYDEYFKPLQNEDVRLLELGVYHGGSLLLWRDYFAHGLIAGLDLNPVEIDDSTGRIRFYQGQQQDTRLLDRIASETAPEGFDIIIDDCSHIGELTRVSFWHLFDKHLKSGGLYVIEDWGTGYWESWPDGVSYHQPPKPESSMLQHRVRRAFTRLRENRFVSRLPLAGKMLHVAKRAMHGRQFRSHDFGMVGFVKELIDECGMADITHPVNGIAPQRSSKFREMRISHSHLFVIKA